MQGWPFRGSTHSNCDIKAVLADAMPTMGHLQPQFPYLSCCNRRGFTSTILIPSDLEPARFLEQPLRSGANDTRDPRAIFLGSPTGDLAAGFYTAQRPAAGVQLAGAQLAAFLSRDQGASHRPAWCHSCHQYAAHRCAAWDGPRQAACDLASCLMQLHSMVQAGRLCPGEVVPTAPCLHAAFQSGSNAGHGPHQTACCCGLDCAALQSVAAIRSVLLQAGRTGSGEQSVGLALRILRRCGCLLASTPPACLRALFPTCWQLSLDVHCWQPTLN